jgi:hypothetical protein
VKLSLSNYVMFAPAAALILVGVASVAFAVGSNSGHPAPAANGMATNRMAAPSSPAAVSSGIPGIPREPGEGFSGGAPVAGIVASKTASTIVVTTLTGKTVTVDVSSATRYLVRGVAGPSLADIAVGSRIAAQGTFNADGSLNATQVQAGSRGGSGGFEGGRGRTGVPTPIPSGPST